MIILAIFLFLLFMLLSLIIYSCIRISTPYDCTEDDKAQEEFIRNYKKAKKNSRRNFVQK